MYQDDGHHQFPVLQVFGGITRLKDTTNISKKDNLGGEGQSKVPTEKLHKVVSGGTAIRYIQLTSQAIPPKSYKKRVLVVPPASKSSQQVQPTSASSQPHKQFHRKAIKKRPVPGAQHKIQFFQAS